MRVTMNDSDRAQRITRRSFLRTSTCLAATAACAPGLLRASDHVEWLDEVQQPPPPLDTGEMPNLRQLLVTDQGNEIATRVQWEARRAELRDEWLKFLGAYGHNRRAVPDLTVLDEQSSGGVIQQHVRYESEPGWPVEAYLFAPSTTDARRPAVAVFHSTVNHSIRQPAGLEGRPELALGRKLAEQGLVTISPRNFLWPDNDHIATEQQMNKFYQQRLRSRGMAKMLYDAQLALDILVQRTDVDPARLGAFGHSLGAKEVLYLAAFDKRVKATVSSEGGIGLRFSNWNAPWYLAEDAYQMDFAHEHHELLAMIAPRAFLLIGGDSADGRQSWPFIEAALPVYQLYDSKPRLGLLNHSQGHAFPPVALEKTIDWLKVYLNV